MIKVFCDKCQGEVHSSLTYLMAIKEGSRTPGPGIKDAELCHKCYLEFKEWLGKR